jgi:hypothetical protein
MSHQPHRGRAVFIIDRRACGRCRNAWRRLKAAAAGLNQRLSAPLCQCHPLEPYCHFVFPPSPCSTCARPPRSKSKLYRFDNETNEWKERGVGHAKVLEHKENKRVRFLFRQEKTLKIRANHIGAGPHRRQGRGALEAR